MNKQIIKFTLRKFFNLIIYLGFREEPRTWPITESLYKYLFTWVTCEGHQGMKRFKCNSSFATRLILGLEPNRIQPYKIHREFIQVGRLGRRSRMEAIYWVTVLNIHRMVTLKPEYKVDTITGISIGNESHWSKVYLPLVTSTCDLFNKTYKVGTIKTVVFKWHISGSGGPNGSPAFHKYIEDYCAISNNGNLQKVWTLMKSLPIINREMFRLVVSDLSDFLISYQSTDESQNFLDSRLSFLSDKAGKTRIIASIDIFSQSILKPVHDHLTNLLRGISMDGTFDQDAQRRRVKKWTMSKAHISSIDLTACTDRFPSKIQALLLVSIGALTPDQAEAWLGVMTDRTFYYKVKGKINNVRYAVGQPMGALSSWPAMAVSHHVLVQLSYRATYLKSEKIFFDYALLGDDLVIKDKLVAETYKDLITSLGMEWSPSKSYEETGVAEFAKSLFREGNDLTPFPLALLPFKKNTYMSDILAIMETLSNRSLTARIEEILSLQPKDSRSQRNALLAMLSPKSNKKCLVDYPNNRPMTFYIFENYLLSRRISHFCDHENWSHYTYAFQTRDPANQQVKFTPHRQICSDNSNNYPAVIQNLDVNQTSEIMVGLDFIAYCPICWPEGLPKSLLDRRLIPGPSWSQGYDDVILRSSLSEMNRFVPGYFLPR